MNDAVRYIVNMGKVLTDPGLGDPAFVIPK